MGRQPSAGKPPAKLLGCEGPHGEQPAGGATSGAGGAQHVKDGGEGIHHAPKYKLTAAKEAQQSDGHQDHGDKDEVQEPGKQVQGHYPPPTEETPGSAIKKFLLDSRRSSSHGITAAAGSSAEGAEQPGQGKDGAGGD